MAQRPIRRAASEPQKRAAAGLLSGWFRNCSSDVPMSIARVAGAESRARRAMDRASYQRFQPLVRRTAIRLARRVAPSITVSDLVAYGWIGLLEACRRRSADMPCEEFEAYALYRVRGAMLDCVRIVDPATREMRAASASVTRSIRELSQRLGRQPEEGEIARSLGMLLPSYRKLLEKIEAAGLARLELLDLDVERKSESVGRAASKLRLADALAVAVTALSPELLNILVLYYQEKCTSAQVGRVLGVSESRAAQLHSEAIHRLRAGASKA